MIFRIKRKKPKASLRYPNLMNHLVIPIGYHFMQFPLQRIFGQVHESLLCFNTQYGQNNLIRYSLSQVKWWITFNEPDKIVDGYTGTGYAPALGAESGTVGYNVIHNIIRAHGKAYRLYEKTYKSTQNGKRSVPFFTLLNL